MTKLEAILGATVCGMSLVYGWTMFKSINQIKQDQEIIETLQEALETEES